MTGVGWGILRICKGGVHLRLATREEWRRCADVVNGGGVAAETGIFELDGVSVYVSGGPEMRVDFRQVAELRHEAGMAGDKEQYVLCTDALGLQWGWTAAGEAAMSSCAQVILGMRMTDNEKEK